MSKIKGVDESDKNYFKYFCKTTDVFGIKIYATENVANEKIFHAGTVERNGEIMTNGGRVLCATSLGDTVTEAQKNAYELAKFVSWESLYFRTDIAYRAIERENTSDE